MNVKVLFSFAGENAAGTKEWSGRKLKRTGVELNRNETFRYGFWMVSLEESVTPNSFREVNVFSAGGRKGNADPGSAVKSMLESAADGLKSVELTMHGHTTGVQFREGGVIVNRRENRQCPHEVSGGGTAGHRYRGRVPTRIMVPMPQRGQRLAFSAAMASSS